MKDAPMITQSQLKEILHYNSSTGVFTWIKNGKTAGNTFKPNIREYRRINLFGKNYYSHRLAWFYIHGNMPESQVDHIDGNGLNNRICNLRDVSGSENLKNQRIRKTNTSGHTGVSYAKDRNKWHAQIQVNKKKKSLGHFASLEDAISAREEANKKYGYHENHGRAI